MAMFIHFFCLCPLSLTIKLNFDISKVAYCRFRRADKNLQCEKNVVPFGVSTKKKKKKKTSKHLTVFSPDTLNTEKLAN